MRINKIRINYPFLFNLVLFLLTPLLDLLHNRLLLFLNLNLLLLYHNILIRFLSLILFILNVDYLIQILICLNTIICNSPYDVHNINKRIFLDFLTNKSFRISSFLSISSFSLNNSQNFISNCDKSLWRLILN